MKIQTYFSANQQDGSENLIIQGFNLPYDSEYSALEGLLPWVAENKIKNVSDLANVFGLNELDPEFVSKFDGKNISRTDVNGYKFTYEPIHDIRDDVDGEALVVTFENKDKTEVECIKFEMYENWFTYTYTVSCEKNNYYF